MPHGAAFLGPVVSLIPPILPKPYEISGLKEVARAAPRKSLVLYYMALLHFREGRYAEAEAQARLAIEQDSGMIEARVMLVNLELEQKNDEAARENLEGLRKAMNNGIFTKFVADQIATVNE
jgi:hypothetical protein